VLEEAAEMRQELFTGRKVLLDSHPRTRPVIEIPAVFRDIDGCLRPPYGGRYSVGRHGTDHDSKPLLPAARPRLPESAFPRRQESPRSISAAAKNRRLGVTLAGR
jgi:hypothetical protein